MPHLIAGTAARKRSEKIVALPGETGLIFYGPYIDLESSGYRLTLEVDYKRSEGAPGVGSGLSLELVCGPWLLGHDTLSIDELNTGTVRRDFKVSSQIGDAAHSPRIETRLRTLGRGEVTVARVHLEEIRIAGDAGSSEVPLLGDASRYADVDYLPLLHLGPAGVSDVSPGGDGGFVIHTNPGVASYICYGPYFWAPAGWYTASFEFTVHVRQWVRRYRCSSSVSRGASVSGKAISNRISGAPSGTRLYLRSAKISQRPKKVS